MVPRAPLLPLALLVVAVVAGGCIRTLRSHGDARAEDAALSPHDSSVDVALADHQAEMPGADLLPPADSASRDLSADLLPPADGAPKDLSADLLPPADSAPRDLSADLLPPADSAPKDLSADLLPPADSAPPDAPASDLPPPADSAPPDSTGPVADFASPPCASGASVVQFYASNMVTCRQPLNGKFQCTAATLCGPGWTLCTSSQFLARGGATTPTTQYAWLSGCLALKGQSFTAPSDTPCVCSLTSISGTPAAWSCDNSGSVKNTVYQEQEGIQTAEGCRRLGVDKATTAGYWLPILPLLPLDAAVCCSP